MFKFCNDIIRSAYIEMEYIMMYSMSDKNLSCPHLVTVLQNN